MQTQQIKYIAILLTSLFHSTRSVTDVNGTYQVPSKVHDDPREPRINQRIVKLYTGVKREPIECTEEGFHADPFDCSLFYQCVHSKKGKFFVFRHQCGPGTIFDTEKNICNHPKSTSRRKCNEYQNAVPFQKNEIDTVNDELYSYNRKNELTTESDFHKINTRKIPTTESYPVLNAVLDKIPKSLEELPKPLKDNIFILNYDTKSTTEYSDTTPFGLKTSKRSITHQERVSSENICTKDGFIGDSENCKLFYRCISNGRGGFSRYEFSCSDSTVWDDEIDACNHPWAVTKQRCKEQYKNHTNLPSLPELILPKSNKSEQFETSTLGLQEIPVQTSINKENVIQSQLQMNNIHLTNNSIDSNNIQNINSTNSGFNIDLKQTETIHQNVSQHNTHTAVDKTTICSESGFIGDKHDCKRFYRCVDNGKGNFIKYEYTCGDGTVWDQQIEGCNHAWAVKECAGRNANEVINQTMVSQTLPNYQSSTESMFFETDDSGYSNSGEQNQSKPPSVSTNSVISKPISTTTKSNIDAQICKNDGFFGDVSNCKKFYRCVDNGKGGYIKYEYSCGEGTLFDSSIQACNHAWAVQNCGVSSMDNLNDISTTTRQETLTTVSLHTTTTQKPISNYDDETGYGQSQQNSQSPVPLVDNSSITAITTNRPIQYLNKCTSSGFMADEVNCKKFYRCVDNGNDNFIQYEFTCGEGTVWDQSIESCNYEWASSNCQNNITDLHQGTVISTIKPTGQNYSQSEISTISSILTQETTQSFQQGGSQQQCVQEGFIGDANDCQKFYRCVPNEKGGYVKHAFFCGDGTIWDENILACNHNSDDKKCNTKEIYLETSSTVKNNATINTETSTKPNVHTSTTENSSEQNKIDICDSEGFYANSNDCMKFYRCVADGQGTYFKYDFVCGEDTVWDQEIQACNHASGDKKCSKTNSDSKPENANTDNPTANVTSTPQTDFQSATTILIDSRNCSTEGFFANKNDCRKFYRCVNNGNGGYTKYDFTCGEGTVWVQEIQACDHDNNVENCSAQNGNDVSSSQNNQETPETTSTNTLLISSTSQTPDEENSTVSSTESTKDSCTSEGFYPMKNNCKMFYRCVDNGRGGFTKYEFTCGDGTAWDSTIQSCNYISYVENCQSDLNNSSTESNKQEEQHHTTETSTKPLGTSLKPNTCHDEGYYGDSNNCKKFFRCVDNGNGEYIKYEYNCGDGTIWDQDITACNHPQDVANPSCKDDVTHSTSIQSTSTQKTSTQMTSTQSLSTQSSSTQSSTSEENSVSEATSTTSETNEQAHNNNTSGCDNSDNKNFTCTKAGFYANPSDCRKFYRCVDWDGNGKRFSIYHFECGEGTIWDPNLETCNYEESIYPPRNCKGLAHNQNTTQETMSTSTTTQKTTSKSTTKKPTQETTSTSTTTQKTTSKSTTKKPTTKQPTTVSQPSTSEKTTTEQTTTQQITTSDSTTTDKSTTVQSTTTESTTTHSSTTTDEQTTKESSTEISTTPTTTQTSTTTDEPTTQQSSTDTSTTSSTTQSSTTTDEPSTQQSSTETSTTESSTESSTQESTTQQTTTAEPSTTQSTTSKEELTTQQSTTEQSTTESTSENTTQESTTQQSTTEKPEESSTTTESSNSEKECPETDDDQYVLVCPTSFKRHPKYCNLFYQCTENDDTHEANVATFRCPNNTIYDENKIQCVEENKAGKKCNGEIAKLTKIKRLGLNNNEPITVGRKRLICSSEGHFPFEWDYVCSPAFLKCQNTKLGIIKGTVFQCPPGYIYWSISRRCEQKTKVIDCKVSSDNWINRWNIPFEQTNIAV